ncbi:aminotransferase class IV [Pacificibacter sp. AS14]
MMPSGVEERIFLNERGEVCDGTITNIFVQKSNLLLTPPRSSGLLPGIYG